VRRSIVWALCNHASQSREGQGEITIEMPDNATDEECEEACADALDTLIGNEFDTGWNEVMPDGTEK